MPKNRAAFEASVLRDIESLAPGTQNAQMYKDFFAGLSDEDFDVFVENIRAEKEVLTVIMPNLSDHKLTVPRNLKLAKDWGHEFYSQIWMNPGNGVPPYLTPRKYLVLDLPLGRQAQHVVKKISIPEDNKTIDDLTGQPTGSSQGSKISYPEAQVLAALNLDHSIVEFMKFRGGDIKGFNAMTASINQTGGVSLEQIKKLGSTVKSTQTLWAYLTSMHIENSLLGKPI